MYEESLRNEYKEGIIKHIHELQVMPRKSRAWKMQELDLMFMMGNSHPKIQLEIDITEEIKSLFFLETNDDLKNLFMSTLSNLGGFDQAYKKLSLQQLQYLTFVTIINEFYKELDEINENKYLHKLSEATLFYCDWSYVRKNLFVINKIIAYINSNM